MRTKNSLLYRVLWVGLVLISLSGTAFEQRVIEQAFEKNSPAVCLLQFTQALSDPRTGETRAQNGSAVAVIVSPDGLLITNGHIQREGVTSYNFRVVIRREGTDYEYEAVILDKPKDINISLLRIQSEVPVDLPYIKFARSPKLLIGEEVAILGVFGETLDFQRSIIVGRIAAVIEKPRKAYCLAEGLRLGYVAGPVVNAAGEVVGITGFELSAAEGGDLYTRSGHPLVFQSDLFLNYVENPPDEMIEKQEDEEAWLGVFTQPLKEEYARYWGIEQPGGLIVSSVLSDSPAAAVGLLPGDIIRAFDGQPIRALQDRDVITFTQLVREKKPHSVIEMEILRNGETKTVLVTLGARPRSTQEADEYVDETFGMIVRELTRDIKIMLNLGDDVQGVIVRQVVSGSPAHAARIQPGVIIMSLNSMAITNLEDYQKALEAICQNKPQEVSVFARVGPATGFFRVRPRW